MRPPQGSGGEGLVFGAEVRARGERSASPPAGPAFHEVLPVMERMMDAKIATVAATTDVKLASLKQEITDQTGQIVKVIIGTAAGGVFAVLGVMIGVLAYGGDRFDGGIQGASLTVQQSEEARALAKQNGEQIGRLTESISKRDGQIDALITLMERRNQ